MKLARWFATLPNISPWPFWLSVGCKVALFVLMLVAFWCFAQVIEAFLVNLQPPPKMMLIALMGVLFSAFLVKGAFIYIQHYSKRVLENTLQKQLLERFQHEQHALLRRRSSFYWQSLWLTHIPALRDWRYDYQVQQWVAVLTPIVIVAVVIPVNYVVGLTLVLAMPLVPFFMYLVGWGAANAQRKQFVALSRLGGLFVDRLKKLPIIASYNGFAQQYSLLLRASEQFNRRTMKVVSLAFLSNTVLDFFSTIAMALVAVFIGFRLLGEITIGPDIEFAQGLWLLLSAPLVFNELKLLGQFYHQKAHAETAYSELQALLPMTSPPLDKSTFNGIRWDTFHIPVIDLKANHLALQVGECIKVSGRSGAGKTIFLEALLGHQSASHQLGTDCVMLTQSPVILPSSIRDNLCLGHDYDQTAMHNVLTQVGLMEWVNALPEGINTVMGQYPRLSGGQAQRLALARLLLHPASVWLLDEPTAHLPQAQHEAISTLIKQLSLGKTVVWSSHKELLGEWFNQTWHIESGAVMVHTQMEVEHG